MKRPERLTASVTFALRLDDVALQLPHLEVCSRHRCRKPLPRIARSLQNRSLFRPRMTGNNVPEV